MTDRQAVQTQPFYHIGRWHQRKLILERIERSFGHPEVIDFQEADLQIEHIMPQTLTQEWRAISPSSGKIRIRCSQLVHTLGNLTLTAFNGTLSNNPFERKQEIYEASHLEMNRALVETDVWGRDQILDRAATSRRRSSNLAATARRRVTSDGEGVRLVARVGSDRSNPFRPLDNLR